GARWYMGPEAAVDDEDSKAVDPTMKGSIGFLRDRGLITWLIGKPNEGVLGAIGIGLTADVDAKTAALSLGATIMPGPPDATRNALAVAAKIRCDGPPLGKQDATLLEEASPPPSTGLRVRVLPMRVPIEIASDVCPRLLRPSLARFGELLASIGKGRWRRE